jgi:hypothetical protein
MTSERRDWVDWIAHRLIHLAARCAPDFLSARLEEEWLADLAAQRGLILRLRFALGCCWAIRIIAHEHAVPALPAATSPAAHRHFIRFPQDEFPFFTGGAIAFVLVVSLQVAVLYGVAIGLSPNFSKNNSVPLVIQVVERQD